VLRFFFLSHHYRSRVDYDPDMLEEAAASLRRIDNFWLRLPDDDGADAAPEVQAAHDAVFGALDDDFNAPAALAALYEFINAQNRAERPAPGSRRLLEEFDRVFAVLPAAAGDDEQGDEWISAEVERRQQLRAERKFAEADEVRDRLREMGVVIEDTADGVRWHREVPA
jgi:cysteinyl-tRNA synthetase